MRERAHEQTVMPGREGVKDKTSEAVRRCGGVRTSRRITRDCSEDWVVRKCAAGIREGTYYAAESRAKSWSLRQSRDWAPRADRSRTSAQQKVRVFRRPTVACSERQHRDQQGEPFKGPVQWSST